MFTELIKNGSKLLENVYNDLAQPGVKKIGIALETVLDFSNTLLYPLRLTNEKARINFQKNLDGYRQKLEKVKEEDIIQVSPELGVPILEKLTYVQNQDISDLFINLLSSASTTHTVSLAHPSFINLINSISVDEARIIHYLFKNDCPNIRFIYFKKQKTDSKEYNTSKPLLTGLENDIDFLFPQNISVYLNNFLGLGILEYNDDKYFTLEQELYNKLEQIYSSNKIEYEAYIDQRSAPNTYQSTKVIRGFYQITDYGKLFIYACGNSEVT